MLLLLSGMAVVLAAAPSTARSPEAPLTLEPVVEGIDPAAEANATISGLVRGPEGNLIDNVQVEAVPASDPLAEPLASALTYAGGSHRHGHYALKVPAGSYLVRFSSPEDAYRVFSTRYHGGGVGTPVSVAGGATEQLEDFTMVDAAEVAVTGRVLSDSGAPLPYASVQLTRHMGGDDGRWTQVDHAQTDASGRYRFDNAVRDRRLTVMATSYSSLDGQVPLMQTWLGDVTTQAPPPWSSYRPARTRWLSPTSACAAAR